MVCEEGLWGSNDRFFVSNNSFCLDNNNQIEDPIAWGMEYYTPNGGTLLIQIDELTKLKLDEIQPGQTSQTIYQIERT